MDNDLNLYYKNVKVFKKNLKKKMLLKRYFNFEEEQFVSLIL